MSESLREELERTKKQIDGAAEIWLYALKTAERLVDENLPFKEGIDKATLPSEKYKWMQSREEAVSTVLANLLGLSELVRI